MLAAWVSNAEHYMDIMFYVDAQSKAGETLGVAVVRWLMTSLSLVFKIETLPFKNVTSSKRIQVTAWRIVKGLAS